METENNQNKFEKENHSWKTSTISYQNMKLLSYSNKKKCDIGVKIDKEINGT